MLKNLLTFSIDAYAMANDCIHFYRIGIPRAMPQAFGKSKDWQANCLIKVTQAHVLQVARF
jgi:hypothetical protein